MTEEPFRFPAFTPTDMQVFVLFCKALVTDDDGHTIARVVDVRAHPEYTTLTEDAFLDSVRFLTDRHYLRPIYFAAYRMAATYGVDPEALAVARNYGLVE